MAATGRRTAYCNIHFTKQAPGYAKPAWRGRACRSVDHAADAIEWLLKQPDTRDIYVRLSTQHRAEERVGKHGKTYYTPVRNQANAIALKTLFLDVDVKGGGGGYKDLGEAATALQDFLRATSLPKPSLLVRSGGGLHVYWELSRALMTDEWRPLARALVEATKQHGLKCDTAVTMDSARILRVPGTSNFKTDPPRPVTLVIKPAHFCYSVERIEQALKPYKVAAPHGNGFILDPKVFPPRPPLSGESDLSAGIDRPNASPVDIDTMASECAFVNEALATGGATYTNPLWNLTTLIATFCQDSRAQAHRMGDRHPGYSVESTDQLFDRKEREREEKDLGWPSCQTISGCGCKLCQACPHFKEGKSPLNFAAKAVTSKVTPISAPAESVSFADPWAEFIGPPFPLRLLPSPLASFVDAEHRAMGADPAALAMAALTAVAGALDAETYVSAGAGWDERPILWTALVGPPSAMKSPIVQKVIAPLRKIDHQRDATWRHQKSIWEQAKAAKGNPGPYPPRPPRSIIQDATPEKIAEILSRDPSGALLVHDELAGWLGSFERYNSGQTSRAFYLSAWNGGTFLKDRVGQGARDDHAEIRVENLALSVLGGIQPDRLADIRDLTSDGLLQRFLPVLMGAPERGDEHHPVAAATDDYTKLIHTVQSATIRRYEFAPDAIDVRTRVLDRLFSLERVEGFSSALIGAIGKLRGYYARLALTLHVAAEHASSMRGQGLGHGASIPRGTAEAAEQLLFDFLLPHIFGLYDVVANGGKERETVRAIASFILASDKDRLRPSDITAGIRKLRGEPQKKIAEWAGRFCAMGWLRPENENTTTPSAWLVIPGLRENFAERRDQAKAARAQAHAILKAGGTCR